jgi:hypothetical protein
LGIGGIGFSGHIGRDKCMRQNRQALRAGGNRLVWIGDPHNRSVAGQMVRIADVKERQVAPKMRPGFGCDFRADASGFAAA